MVSLKHKLVKWVWDDYKKRYGVVVYDSWWWQS